MGKFYIFSLILHIVVIFSNVYHTVYNKPQDFDRGKISKITVIKMKNVQPQVLNFNPADSIPKNFATPNVIKKLTLPEQNNPINLPVIVTPTATVKTILQQIKVPNYLIPSFSQGKLLKKNHQDKKNNLFQQNNTDKQIAFNNISPNTSYRVTPKENIKKPKNNTMNDEIINKYIELYRDEIFTIVYRRFYEEIRNKKIVYKETDTVTLAVNVNQKGEILNVNFKTKSSIEDFDKFCLNIIKDIGKFPPFPEVVKVDVIKLYIPFRIKLGRKPH